MLTVEELREYRCSNMLLQWNHIDVLLKSHDVNLMLDVPDCGIAACYPPALASLAVLRAHTEYKKLLLPDVVEDDAFYKRCAAEVNVINLFFPAIKSEPIRICFTAWLAFVITMDDILEILAPLDGEMALKDSVQIILSLPMQRQDSRNSIDTRIQDLTRTLHRHCTQWLSPKSALSFFNAVSKVFQAHIHEIRFLQGQIPNDLPRYMEIRECTIALTPFFEIIKTELLPEASRFDTSLGKLEATVCRVAGLQNDLIGLERDIEDGESLNAVLVLMASNNAAQHQEGGELFSQHVRQICDEHNSSARQAVDLYLQIRRENVATQSVIETARHILLMCETHLKWCTTSKRYGMRIGQGSEINSVV
ncbi:isoprenoid synthase domain-containing protein [Nemania sp. FL0916]|nr:isoprenoid synthase domain-containing protein [Nemania sp. FL0916]